MKGVGEHMEKKKSPGVWVCQQPAPQQLSAHSLFPISLVHRGPSCSPSCKWRMAENLEVTTEQRTSVNKISCQRANELFLLPGNPPHTLPAPQTLALLGYQSRLRSEVQKESSASSPEV